MGVGSKGANGKERRKGERPGVSINAGLHWNFGKVTVR